MHIQALTFNPFQENTYLLWNNNHEAAIVDPGCLDAYEEQHLLHFIEKNGLKPVLLINTHMHLDHIFGNQFVSKQWNLKAKASLKDQFWLDKFEKQCVIFGITPPPSKGPMIVEGIQEGDTLFLGDEKIEIYEVPGHSPGSLVLYMANDHALIAGDVLFKGSVGRTDLEKGSHETIIEGIRKKILTLPEQTIVYPGHGSTTTVGQEKKSNPFLWE